MGNRNGTVRQRILGRRLRRLREEAGHTQAAAAAALEISDSKLGRIETAQQGVDVHMVRSMLDLYDIGGDAWTETLQLVRDTREKPWWARYRLDGKVNFVAYESDAEQVQEYATGFVPGLLRVPDYARSLFESSKVRRSAEILEMAIEVRMIRQKRLTDEDDPLRFGTVIAESVLRNPVGGREVMSAQLRHLVESTELPTVSMQVLPAHSGAHASLASGFVILGFGDLAEPTWPMSSTASAPRSSKSRRTSRGQGRSSTSCVPWR